MGGEYKRVEDLLEPPPNNNKETYKKARSKDNAQKVAEDIVSNQKALDVQVGGSHYKKFKIQPTEFLQANQIPHCEANVIKYVCRHKDKGGIQDLKKAKHYIDLLIQIEYGEEA